MFILSQKSRVFNIIKTKSVLYQERFELYKNASITLRKR